MKESPQTKTSGQTMSTILSFRNAVILLWIVAASIATIDQGPYVLLNAIITGGMYALMAMGLALVFGVMNIPQFAHGEFFMIGTLVAYYVFKPFSIYLRDHPIVLLKVLAPLVAMLIAALAGIVAGFLLEKTVFSQLRKRSKEEWVMNTFLLTLGINIFFVTSHQLVFGTNLKGIVSYWQFPALNIFNVFVSIDRAFAFFIAVVLMAGLGIFMKYTKTGQSIRAVSQDEAGSHLVGINASKVFVLTMCLSCALAAVAGASVLFMYPSYPMVGFQPLYMSWFVVIVVGLGNVPGCLFGGFVVALIQVLTTSYIGEGWDFVIPAVIICVLLIVKPSGIFGTGVRVSVHEK